MSKALDVIQKLIWFILLVQLSFLFIFSCISTAHIDISEHTYFVSDSIIVNCVVVLMIVGISSLIRMSPRIIKLINILNEKDNLYRTVRLIVLLVALLASLIWVLSSRLNPQLDQLEIQRCLDWMRMGDYSYFATQGYIEKYPNQLGFLLFSYTVELIFGPDSNTILQLINVIAFVALIFYMTEIMDRLRIHNLTKLIVSFILLIFFPLILYCSFIYGTLIGHALALAAINYELKFITTTKTKFAVLAAILIGLSIMIKMNYVIFWIGMSIYCIIEIIRSKNKKLLLLIPLLIIVFFVQSLVPISYFRHISNEPIDQGASSWSWIAMGLQEGDKAPGWHNGYIARTYRESEFNKSSQAEVAKQDILNRLSEFNRDKAEAMTFFARKLVSEWCNPSFQAFWIVQRCEVNENTLPWVNSFISKSNDYNASQILNLFQICIYAGSILFALLKHNEAGHSAWMFFALIFVGGFVFHMFWEAKAQYTIAYYILLFPLAVEGYRVFSERLIELFTNKKARTKKKLFDILSVAVVFIILISAVLRYKYGNYDYISNDDAVYSEYLLSDN